jgi:UDP-N-acetylmuramoyl-L-alanyl-D-glutamate--2,6-diaminopimelate ligase
MTSFIAIIDCLGLYDDRILSFLNEDIKIPGRMEEINYQDRRIIVDYAHTPDGVYNVLSFLKTMKRRIILVVGCGGSRDKTKRTVIGEISVSNCDYVIFTSDNPRDEDEMSIIKDIIVDIEKDNYEIEVDRYIAIKKAIKMSKPNDIIAILGRGNEKFQKVRGELIPFNDADAVKEIIRGE